MPINQIQELKSIIMSFRIAELTQLLAYCGQSRLGRKSILQARALDLLKGDNLTHKVQFKIRELGLLQNSSSAANKSTALETPLIQDSSSNECTITEPDMSHTIGFNSTKSQLSDYYSMPKFDLGLLGRNQNANKLAASFNTTTNVQFKPIPFDNVMYTLVEPTLLPYMNKPRFNSYDCVFKLKLEEANEISMTREFKNNKFEFNCQIHLRFCLADQSLPQDDLLPLNLTVKLNQKNIPLPSIVPSNKPNIESKRQSKPIDLTPFCKLSPISKNHLNVNWSQDTNQNKNYCFTIYIARRLSSKELLDKLKEKSILDPSETQRLIISKLTDTDNEISTTSLKSNLNCPLGKMRLSIPVRSKQCNHIQCFDAELYLQMNEKKPSWLCPVCDKQAEYKTLFIDGLFTQILKETPSDSNEIEFSDDGSWKIVQQNLNKTIALTPQRRKIEEETSSIKKSKTEEEEEVIELSSDSDDDNNENLQQPLHMPKLSTLSDMNSFKSTNSFNLFSEQLNQFSTLNQICTQLPSSNLNNLDQNNRGQSRGLITRTNQHGLSFGNFNSQFGINSNDSNSSSSMVRGRNFDSDLNVISLD